MPRVWLKYAENNVFKAFRKICADDMKFFAERVEYKDADSRHSSAHVCVILLCGMNVLRIGGGMSLPARHLSPRAWRYPAEEHFKPTMVKAIRRCLKAFYYTPQRRRPKHRCDLWTF